AGGHLRKLLVATGTAVALNVVLNLLLIPRVGIVGAAVSTAIAYGSMAVTHVLAARSVDLRPLEGLPIGRVFFLGAVTVGVLVALEPLGPWWIDLGVLPWIGLAVYAAGTVVLDVVDPEEVRELVLAID
ncbi:MAG: polysaccharide biosynthesis C-terminal domain-containing protein, partial [Halobacteriales archaeon]